VTLNFIDYLEWKLSPVTFFVKCNPISLQDHLAIATAGRCTTTAEWIICDISSIFLNEKPHFRVGKRHFGGTENPCVAGSIPALPIATKSQ
jgi:hypothetical protein